MSAEAELTAARTTPGALDPLPAEPAAPPRANGTVVNGNGHEHAEMTPEPVKVQRPVPASQGEDLDSHFGGLTTRIGRWLESLSVKRAR